MLYFFYFFFLLLKHFATNFSIYKILANSLQNNLLPVQLFPRKIKKQLERGAATAPKIDEISDKYTTSEFAVLICHLFIRQR